jgi:endogenous inhibitor of DNA gyrase (YacG/DUF329 family)
MSKNKMRMFCPKCDKEAVKDEKDSTANWSVFPVHCPDCGGKWEFKFGK